MQFKSFQLWVVVLVCCLPAFCIGKDDADLDVSESQTLYSMASAPTQQYQSSPNQYHQYASTYQSAPQQYKYHQSTPAQSYTPTQQYQASATPTQVYYSASQQYQQYSAPYYQPTSSQQYYSAPVSTSTYQVAGMPVNMFVQAVPVAAAAAYQQTQATQTNQAPQAYQSSSNQYGPSSYSTLPSYASAPTSYDYNSAPTNFGSTSAAAHDYSSHYDAGTSTASFSFGSNDIIRHHQKMTPSLHHFQYQTSNGIKHQETTRHSNGQHMTKDGEYSYTSPEGQRVAVTYSADDNGFRAQGDHIPT